MKIIILIISVFIIAMFTSALLEWDFIAKNPIRYILVVMLIVFELVTGFFYMKSEIKNLK